MNSLKGVYEWTSKTLLSEDKPRSTNTTQELPEPTNSPPPSSETHIPYPRIHHLENRLLSTTTQNEKLTQENTDLHRQLTALKSKLSQTHTDHAENIKRVNTHYTTNWLPYIRKLESKLKETQSKTTTLERENRMWYAQLLKLRTEHAELQRHSEHAEETSRRCEQQIVKLTETISRAGQREDAKTGRDDDYFATEFSELAGAVQQWVFRHFRGAVERRMEGVEGVLRESLEETVHREELLGKSRAQLDAIVAVVGHQLAGRVFPRFRFLGVAGLHDPFLTVFNCVEGTDLQREVWRARTMDMVFKHESVLKAFDETVKAIAESLEKPFGALAAKGSREEQRNKGLYGLVERTAKLAVEVAQQPSTIELYSITPGELFDGVVMEDTAGDAEEDGQGEGAVVRMQLFPAVLRSDYDQKGKSLGSSVVILKAKVVARVD